MPIPKGWTSTDIDKAHSQISFDARGSSAFQKRFQEFIAGLRYRDLGEPPLSITWRETDGRVIGEIDFTRPFTSLTEALVFEGTTIPLDEVFEIHAIGSQHAGNGMLLLWGRDVKPGAIGEDAYMADVTPTALAILGLPVSRDFDGRPLLSALKSARLPPPPVVRPHPENSVLALLHSIRWRVFARSSLGL
jgi:hypothetical protein